MERGGGGGVIQSLLLFVIFHTNVDNQKVILQ